MARQGPLPTPPPARSTIGRPPARRSTRDTGDLSRREGHGAQPVVRVERAPALFELPENGPGDAGGGTTALGGRAREEAERRVLGPHFLIASHRVIERTVEEAADHFRDPLFLMEARFRDGEYVLLHVVPEGLLHKDEGVDELAQRHGLATAPPPDVTIDGLDLILALLGEPSTQVPEEIEEASPQFLLGQIAKEPCPRAASHRVDHPLGQLLGVRLDLLHQPGQFHGRPTFLRRSPTASPPSVWGARPVTSSSRTPGSGIRVPVRSTPLARLRRIHTRSFRRADPR